MYTKPNPNPQTLTLLYLDVVYVITDCGEVVLVVMVHEL